MKGMRRRHPIGKKPFRPLVFSRFAQSMGVSEKGRVPPSQIILSAERIQGRLDEVQLQLTKTSGGTRLRVSSGRGAGPEKDIEHHEEDGKHYLKAGNSIFEVRGVVKPRG